MSALGKCTECRSQKTSHVSRTRALRKCFLAGERDFIKNWNKLLKVTGRAPDVCIDHDAMVNSFNELIDITKAFDHLDRLKTQRAIKR